MWARVHGVPIDLFDDFYHLWRVSCLVCELLCLDIINLLKHKVPSMYLAIISLEKIHKDIELTVHGWVQRIIF
jgi:hypothetical protein